MGLIAVAGLALAACTTPHPTPMSGTRDHAFIEYWPPAKNSSRLRLAIKDNMDMKGTLTSAGSEYFQKQAKPAERDAECVRRARVRGVQFVGKTNLSEFALHVSGMNEYFGTPRNPLDEDRIPGGSSSGSAVAVATGRADVAYGTDTAGSIRAPAACCGVFGLKTTFGLIPLDGVVPISSTHLDTIGPMAASLENLVRGMDLLVPGSAARYRAAIAAHPRAEGIKVGRLYLPGTDPVTDRAVDRALEAAGFQLVRLDDRFAKRWEQARKDGRTVALAEGWMDNRPFLGQRGVNVITQATIRAGALEYRTRYPQALAGQRAWRAALERALRTVDFIALPTLQGPPAYKPLLFRTPLYEMRVFDRQNTLPVNLAGNPAIAIPIPSHRRGLPISSLQLVGRDRSEAELMNAARLVSERAL